MRYFHFLFTRNQRRDFTAFIRPPGMTNKQVSLLANAFNHINDITPLTPDSPAFFTFPLGEYTFVLRHYDSGRTHSGRAIPVIEGIAVPHDNAEELANGLPHLLSHHADVLRVSASIADLETIEVTTSGEFAWTSGDEPLEDVLVQLSDQELTQDLPEPETRPLTSDFVNHYADERLFVPFNAEGLALLTAALNAPDLPLLNVAFGTNAEVIAALESTGFSFDILSYLTTEAVEYKPRPINKPIRKPAPVAPTVRALESTPQLTPQSTPEPKPIAALPKFEPPRHDEEDEEFEPLPFQRVRSDSRRPLLRVLIDFLLGR